MATHSSVLAWRIPGTGEPGGLPSMGSCGVGHDWSYLAAAAVAATAPYIVCLWVSLHTVVDVSWRCSSYSRISVCVHLVDTLYSVSHISLLKMSLHHFFPHRYIVTPPHPLTHSLQIQPHWPCSSFSMSLVLLPLGICTHCSLCQ